MDRGIVGNNLYVVCMFDKYVEILFGFRSDSGCFLSGRYKAVPFDIRTRCTERHTCVTGCNHSNSNHEAQTQCFHLKLFSLKQNARVVLVSRLKRLEIYFKTVMLTDFSFHRYPSK